MEERELSDQITKLYFTPEHNKLVRWISYWYRINSIMRIKNIKSKKILEIGVGNKFVSGYLKNSGLNVKTLDINKKLKPDYLGNIKNMKQIKNNQFDVVCSFEVLEHMPFEDALLGLKEMRRITSEYVIISIPYFGLCISVYLKPFFSDGGKIIRIPFWIYRPRRIVRKLNISHHWTLGELGTSEKIKEKGFEIIKEEIPILNNHHKF